MSVTPLQRALTWFAERDEMGGFHTVAGELFPGWQPKRSCRAPHRPEKTASFSLYQNERKEWRFKDFGTNEQGGLVGFVMLAGMDEKRASHWLMEKAGVSPIGASIPISLAMSRQKTEIPLDEPETPPGITREAFDAWFEGVDHLQGSRERMEALAEFRGWPVAWVEYLAECAAISMPLYHGQRTIAFLVEAPTGGRGGLVMRHAGYHCRLEARTGENRAGWRFVPNEKEHGQSTPALPYIISGSLFESAKLLVITGGQWDALTFAFAAGWLGEGCQWPEGVCVIGIRGDASSHLFLRYYERFWPGAANCLLLPDGDPSGDKWFAGADSFAKRLAVRCRKVAVVKCSPHKDFNDLHRAAKITPEQIAELLASHRMAVEGRVTK